MAPFKHRLQQGEVVACLLVIPPPSPPPHPPTHTYDHPHARSPGGETSWPSSRAKGASATGLKKRAIPRWMVSLSACGVGADLSCHVVA